MIHFSYSFFFFFVASLLLLYPLKGFMYMPSLLQHRYYKDELASPECNQRSTAFTNHFKIQCRYAASSTRRVRTVLEEGNNFFDGEQLSSPYYHMSFKDEADELRYRIARRKVLGPGLAVSEPLPENVYVVLFYPDTENEGVHTIEFPKGSGKNFLLAFEDYKECLNFALVLKDQKFFDPTPQQINYKSLSDYCHTISLALQIVPKGTNLLPPFDRVDNLSYNQTLQQYATTLESMFDSDMFYEDEAIMEGDGALFDNTKKSNDELSSWQ